MARFIRVEGARSQANAIALLPPPIRTPAASTEGLVQIAGAPGTLRVPTPRPAGIPQMQSRHLWGVQPTNVGHSFMLPRLFTTGPKKPQLVDYTSRGELPIPALGYVRVPTRQNRPLNTLGNRVIAWPRGVVRPRVIGGSQGVGTGA